MIHVLQHQQPLADDLIGPLPLEVAQKPDTAGVGFKLGVKKALFARVLAHDEITRKFRFDSVLDESAQKDPPHDRGQGLLICIQISPSGLC
jgi:hypothetical protein